MFPRQQLLSESTPVAGERHYNCYDNTLHLNLSCSEEEMGGGGELERMSPAGDGGREGGGNEEE